MYGTVTRQLLLHDGLVGLGALSLAAAGCTSPRGQEAMPIGGTITPGTKVSVLKKGSFYAKLEDAGHVQPALKQWQEKTGLIIDPIDVGTAATNEKLQVMLAAGTHRTWLAWEAARIRSACSCLGTRSPHWMRY